MEDQKLKVRQAIIQTVDYDQVYEACMSLRAGRDMMTSAADEFNRAGGGDFLAVKAQILAAGITELLEQAARSYEIDIGQKARSEEVLDALTEQAAEAMNRRKPS